jgi:hypothetical protein
MDHNKLIAAAAKKALIPLGLRRDGKSRIWYDDHGWWAIVVEFQPSSWSRGSYLNVNLSWMLYENAHWTFDIGGRVGKFESAEEGKDFEAAINSMATRAAQSVLELRERFLTLDQMYEHYRTAIERHGGWPDYEAGILAGLRNDWVAAEQHFNYVLSLPASTTWNRALQFRCQDLMRLMPEPKFFRDSIMGIVLRCRSARCLDEMPMEEIALP